jgi:hypothetical protein
MLLSMPCNQGLCSLQASVAGVIGKMPPVVLPVVLQASHRARDKQP